LTYMSQAGIAVLVTKAFRRRGEFPPDGANSPRFRYLPITYLRDVHEKLPSPY
jgi:hypothetical protein